MKRVLLLTLVTLPLFANVGAILLVPRDAKVVVRAYSGVSKTSSVITIESTNDIIDGASFSYDSTNGLIGGAVGIQNSFYRLSLSYDIDSNTDVKLQRALLNSDFKFYEQDGFKPLVGFGVGVAMSAYAVNQKNIKQDNGVLALRTGAEYVVDESNSLEFLLEYSYILTSKTGVSYYEGSDFTTYNIKKQNTAMLLMGYSFEF
ncbi:MAG: hypothetical protein WBF77_06480 [Sulfurimonadaceae bacterium]